DTKRDQALPDGVSPMPVLSDAELADYPEMTPGQVVGWGVRRYWDMVALAKDMPCKVIGATGIIRDRPGFEVDLVSRSSSTDAPHHHDRPSVLMPVRGHWTLTWGGADGEDGGRTTLAPGDTASVPADLPHAAFPSMEGEAALYHIVGTDDPAGPSDLP
ncbi:MAG: cupin, partial [Pseudomonadota bacterium]